MKDDAIDVRLARQFLAVAELRHMGRAAERLGMTQPPLTMAMQQLERRLGVALFDRRRRSVALTAAGEALIEPLRRWLNEAAAVVALVRAAADGGVGRLRLAFVSTVGFGPLPAWLRAFGEAQPGVEVSLREATSDVQLEALAAHEIDAGFLLHAQGIAPAAGRSGLATLHVAHEPMVLALPEGHALARAARLPLAPLLAEPLVIFPRAIAPSLHDAVLACYHRHGASPRLAQEAIQMQTIVNLVSAGLGLAWVPATMMELQRAGVVYRALPPVLARAAPRCETSLVWRTPPAPAVARFVALVEAAASPAARRPAAAVSAAVSAEASAAPSAKSRGSGPARPRESAAASMALATRDAGKGRPKP
jgi:DNA-binding transcriptional LysR family regulator